MRLVLIVFMGLLATVGPRSSAAQNSSGEPARDDALTGAIKRTAASGSQGPAPSPVILRELPPTPGTASLGASAANRSAKLTVHSVSVRQGYGAATPKPGSSLLVLDSEWENIIPLSFIYERQVATTTIEQLPMTTTCATY